MPEGPDPSVVVSRLKEQYSKVLKRVSLDDVRDELSDLESTLNDLPGELDKARRRGYEFAAHLSEQIGQLKEEWPEVRTRSEELIKREAAQLKSASVRLEPLLKKLGAAATKPAALATIGDEFEKAVREFDDEVDDAVDRIRAVFESVSKRAREARNQLYKIDRYLDALEEATFELNPGETLYLVAKGEWIRSGRGKEDPDGLFYLTDQRLIFERKEKEGGFLGFGAKKVQGIEWALPLQAIEEIDSEKKGFLGGKDIVHIKHRSSEAASPITIEVKDGLNANWYAQQLRRAQSGEIDDEREGGEVTAPATRPEAPTACENCGAPFSTPVTARTTELACEYCGTIVRL
ncbi:MAG: hypothetical protein Kow0077_18470 [Anaerolineae bacterium]